MQFHPSILSQLKHDAPYAWFLRDAAEYNPNYKQPQVGELDERLDAYLHCLVLSETKGAPVLADISIDDWGAVFTVAYVALEIDSEEAFLRAVEGVQKEQQSRELSDALCRFSFDRVQPYILKISHHSNPWVQTGVISAVGYHFQQINPDWLRPHLNSDSSAVQIAALDLIGARGLHEYTDDVTNHLQHDQGDVRFQAAYTASLLGIEAAYPILMEYCVSDNPHLRKALGLIYHLDLGVDKAQMVSSIQNGEYSVRIKAYNIAMAGLTDWIPTLLEWMKDPEYAPLAGEAFCFITGADLDADDLLLRNPDICESRDAPLAEKRKQDPWTQAYEADLPWPDAQAVKLWWNAHHSGFQTATRYLSGRTLTPENMQRVSEEGTQPQRHQAELMLRLYRNKMVE